MLALPATLAVAGSTLFSSAQEALKQGISAYDGGDYEIAIPALKFAADQEEFVAEYYLARIYADNSGSHTDHAKAYMLFLRIADEHIDADPDEDPRALYVGKSLTALAGYVRVGLPEIGLRPDPERAVFYLNNASATFNDTDAQFELAKLQLKGEGLETNVALGKHWLSVLSQNGHAGAQAFLADLLWRGKYMEADQPRALALISIAVQNAPPHERLWIADIYPSSDAVGVMASFCSLIATRLAAMAGRAGVCWEEHFLTYGSLDSDIRPGRGDGVSLAAILLAADTSAVGHSRAGQRPVSGNVSPAGQLTTVRHGASSGDG